jgi:hypothetical protein
MIKFTKTWFYFFVIATVCIFVFFLTFVTAVSFLTWSMLLFDIVDFLFVFRLSILAGILISSLVTFLHYT